MNYKDKGMPSTSDEIELFLNNIKFNLPIGFIDFFKKSNDLIIEKKDTYIQVWPLNEMIELNHEYNVEEFAPDFFIFGSNGGDTAFAVNKKNGNIYEMPFIGMSNDEAVFKCGTFGELMS